MVQRLPSPIRRALDAVNVGDSAAFTACFRPRLGCIDDWGRQHHGDRDIRTWSDQELTGKRTHLKVIHFYLTSEVDTTVIAQLDRTDFHGPATLRFHLHDQHIATLAITA